MSIIHEKKPFNAETSWNSVDFIKIDFMPSHRLNPNVIDADSLLLMKKIKTNQNIRPGFFCIFYYVERV